jgi:hypothetical protein
MDLDLEILISLPVAFSYSAAFSLMTMSDGG